MQDTTSVSKEIVRWARALERARGRRRKAMAALREIDGQIREAQKFLRDLTADPVSHDGAGELLPGEGDSLAREL